MIKLAIAGEFQDGKSTLINALCGIDCAKTGQGIATTAKVKAYGVPGVDIVLLDTPGFNAKGVDSEQACAGIAAADACMYMLSNTQFTARMFMDMKKALQLPGGHYKPLIPIINDRDRNNHAIARESIAEMKLQGLHPILFGEDVPVIHALAWRKGKVQDEEHKQGIRRIKYLLGIEPYSNPSPITKICAMIKTIQQLTEAKHND